MGDALYRLGADEIPHHCIQCSEQRNCKLEAHQGNVSGGHFSREVKPEKYGRLVYGGPQLARVQPNLQKNVTYVPK